MKTRILVFSDWFAPGFRAGGPIQSLVNLTSTLTEFEFYIVTSDTDHHSTKPYDSIHANVWITYREHIQVFYLSKDKLKAEIFAALIEEVHPQKIYLNSLFSPVFTLMPLRLLNQKPNDYSVVVAPRGMLKSSALNEKVLKKKIFLFAARILGWYDRVTWHATNSLECEEIKKHFGKDALVHIADNLASAPVDSIEKRVKIAGQVKMICLARISPEKGIEEALRFLESHHWASGLHIDFIGAQQNEEFYRKCLAWSRQLQGVTCRFLGEMPPSEISSRWKEYHFLYLPTRGENFGHAIAESLNNGVPVIISDRTPWRNLKSLGVGWDLELSQASFLPIVKGACAMGQDEYNQYSEAALAYAKQVYAASSRIQQSRGLFS
jgi:glycosyltransferase involved in cell wall biosynthesis